MRRAVMLLALFILGGLLVTSTFYPKIERLEVSGNKHYSREEILSLANLQEDKPLLWVGKWSLNNLMNDPWIRQARVIRHWPHTVSLTVWERQPVLIKGEQVMAIDGTVLPNAKNKDNLVSLKGWGQDRTTEALELLQVLAEFSPKVLSYSPSGFDISVADSQLYTPNVKLLKQHWAGFLSQQGKKIAIYPWGVSARP